MSNGFFDPDKKKEKAYAFNIDFQKTSGKRILGRSKNNAGFYDDLITFDNQLKLNRRTLSTTKTNGIKELVYTNKKIPEAWTTKVGYQQDLQKIISDDKNFLTYLGKGGPAYNDKLKSETEKNEEHIKQMNSEPISFKTYKDFGKSRHLKLNNVSYIAKQNSGHNDKLSSTMKTRISNVSEVSSQPVVTNSNREKKNKFNSYYTKIHDKNDKQILNILEQYKIDYPLTLPFLSHKEVNKEVSNSMDTASFTKHKIKYQPKSEVLRTSIYNELIKKENIPKKTTPKNTYKKYVDTNNQFLNSTADIFNKRTQITNPLMLKILDDIDYYGPYFSHCPPCRNRNLEFYQNMEVNTSLGLLNYLKKTRIKVNTKESKD